MTSRLFRAYCRLVLRHPLFWLAAVGALCAKHPEHADSIRRVIAQLRVLDTDEEPATSGAATRGEHIGPYKVLDVLGEGGMGTVYRAEQREPVREAPAQDGGPPAPRRPSTI